MRIDDRSLSWLGTDSLITIGGVKLVKKVFGLKVQYDSPTWSKKMIYDLCFHGFYFTLSDKFVSHNSTWF